MQRRGEISVNALSLRFLAHFAHARFQGNPTFVWAIIGSKISEGPWRLNSRRHDGQSRPQRLTDNDSPLFFDKNDHIGQFPFQFSVYSISTKTVATMGKPIEG